MIITKIDNKIEPREPAIVLFGLIFVNFGPLKILPKIKPPISEAAQVKISIKIIIFNCIKFEKKTKIKQKIKI